LLIETDYPALQVYSGQGLDDRNLSPGTPLAFAGLALETEEWPDAINRPDFPSVVLPPGQPYRRQTRWSFSLD
jgi:aldose 1-epimerase